MGLTRCYKTEFFYIYYKQTLEWRRASHYQIKYRNTAPTVKVILGTPFPSVTGNDEPNTLYYKQQNWPIEH